MTLDKLVVGPFTDLHIWGMDEYRHPNGELGMKITLTSALYGYPKLEVSMILTEHQVGWGTADEPRLGDAYGVALTKREDGV